MSHAATGNTKLAVPPSLTIEALDKTHCLASWRNVLFVIWGGAATVPTVNGVGAAMKRLIRANPTGIASFAVILAKTAIPDDAARKQSSLILQENAPGIRAAAVVMEGSGFTAAAARSVLATMMLLSRSRMNSKTFAEVDEAARWQAPLVGKDARDIDPGELAKIVAYMRGELQQKLVA